MGSLLLTGKNKVSENGDMKRKGVYDSHGLGRRRGGFCLLYDPMMTGGKRDYLIALYFSLLVYFLSLSYM